MKEEDYKEAYIKQCTCGAYIFAICQPKTAFNLLVVIQYQDPSINNTKALNLRLK
jgi:hypothetical protein